MSAQAKTTRTRATPLSRWQYFAMGGGALAVACAGAWCAVWLAGREPTLPAETTDLRTPSTSEMPPGWQWIAALWGLWVFVFGACIGSFLNVVVYRVPKGISIVSKPSYCPACGNPISIRDNIPIWGWLWLRGQCRKCGHSISARYPLVEFAVAWMFQWLYLVEVAESTGPAALPAADQTGGGIVALFVTGHWLPLGRFAFHAFLVSALLVLALMAWDRARISWQLGGFLALISLLIATIWPALLPLSPTAFEFSETASAPDWMAHLGPLLGGVAGWALGQLLQRLVRNFTQQAEPPTHAAQWSMALAGMTLGWQLAAVIGAVALVLHLLIGWWLRRRCHGQTVPLAMSVLAGALCAIVWSA